MGFFGELKLALRRENKSYLEATKENFVVNELKDKIGSLSGIDKSTLLIFISGENPSSSDK